MASDREERGYIIYPDNSVKALDEVSLPIYPFNALTGGELRQTINETIPEVPGLVALSGSKVKVVFRGESELIVTEMWDSNNE